jgi:hypothetical protein
LSIADSCNRQRNYNCRLAMSTERGRLMVPLAEH